MSCTIRTFRKNTYQARQFRASMKILVDERTNPDVAYFGASCGQSY
jgi:hypothetical protein